MSDRVTSYDPKRTAVSLAGVTLEGFASGSFITIEKDADDYVDKVGADGEVTRVRNADQRCTVKLKLAQGSKSNTLLSQMRRADLNDPNGAGVGVFRCTDGSSGVELAHGDKAWIMKVTPIERGAEAVETEWTIRIAKGDLDPSGSEAV
jgi:hypothetical protein